MKYSFVFVATALIAARAATAAAIDTRGTGTAVYARGITSTDSPYSLERRSSFESPQRLSARDFDDVPHERRFIQWLKNKWREFKENHDKRMAAKFNRKAQRNQKYLDSHRLNSSPPPPTTSGSMTSGSMTSGSSSGAATSDTTPSTPDSASDSGDSGAPPPDGMSRRGLNDQIGSRDSFSEGLEVRNTLRSDAVPVSSYPKVNMRDIIDARDSVESDLQQRSPGLMQWLGAAKDTLLGTPAPAAPATGASAPMGVGAGMRKREVIEDQYFEARDFDDDLYERAVIDDELYARDYAINDLN